ncbi:hypothetical protein BGW41_004751, partial [Actinomortierella wolfii]
MSYNRHSSIENNMLPWRPLGMLAFGLGVIVVFIRMHGDGYDFPVKVSQSNDSFPLPHEQRHRTDTVVLEVSVLFPEEPAVIHPEHDTTAGARFLEAEVPLEDTDYGQAGEQHEGDFNADRDGIEEHQSQLNEEDRMQQQHDGNSGSSSGYGWTSQWHLGRKRPDDQRDSWVATTPSMQKRGGEEQTWAWLTMIQHEGDRCSPACKDVLNLVYRTSAVALVPKSHPKDKRLSVLLAQVHEDSHTWTYETSISTLEANNQWTREPGTPRRPERLQETDSLYEETTTYTEPKPDPLI